MNCVATLPNRTNFGQFEVRIFADNNWTECVHCKSTSHPSYACKKRPNYQKRCFNCNQPGHIAKNCLSDIRCSFCKTPGHSKLNCESFKEEQARRDFGNYAPGILEGRKANEEDNLETVEKVNSNDCTAQISPLVSNVLLGASNCIRLGTMNEPNLINASISGTTLENVDQCLNLALENASVKQSQDHVKRVIVSLGTNDISKNKDDSDQVNIHAMQALSKVEQTFPCAKIGVCSILPRKGHSNYIMTVNDTATKVNRFLKKFCEKNEVYEFLDTGKHFLRQGAVVKSMFDKDDPSGVHLGPDGVESVSQILCDFLHAPSDGDEYLLKTPAAIERKRNRSEDTASPLSIDRKSKLSKAGSPDSQT